MSGLTGQSWSSPEVNSEIQWGQDFGHKFRGKRDSCHRWFGHDRSQGTSLVGVLNNLGELGKCQGRSQGISPCGLQAMIQQGPPSFPRLEHVC